MLSLCVKPKNGETYLNGLDILIFSEAILVFLRIAKMSLGTVNIIVWDCRKCHCILFALYAHCMRA